MTGKLKNSEKIIFMEGVGKSLIGRQFKAVQNPMTVPSDGVVGVFCLFYLAKSRYYLCNILTFFLQLLLGDVNIPSNAVKFSLSLMHQQQSYDYCQVQNGKYEMTLKTFYTS